MFDRPCYSYHEQSRCRSRLLFHFCVTDGKATFGVALDGDFLNMQEFVNMVNGGGSYPKNGWHGMYAMSGISECNNRIYKVDDGLSLFVDHAIQAARQFISDRRKLDIDWKAK